MAVTPDLTVISLCDLDDWDGGVGAVDIEGQVQGDGCLTITETGAGLRAERWETITTVNMTDGGTDPRNYPVIYGWLSFPALRNVSTKRKGGLRILIRDTAGVKGEWFVAGRDTMATSGWYPYCIRTNRPFDIASPTKRARASNVATLTTDPVHGLAVGNVVLISGVGGTGYNGQYTVASVPTTTTFTYANTGDDEATTDDMTGSINKVSPVPDLTIVNGVGYRVCLDVKGIIKWDAFRYGHGLIITGTETFGSIWAVEDHSDNKYGVIVRTEGVYFVQGKLTLGALTGDTYFEDTSQIIVFMDKLVGSDYYELKLLGGTGDTQIYFGSKVGEAGVSGCVFKSAGAVKYSADVSHADVDKLGLYGCSFLNANIISLPAYSADKKVLSTSFEACAGILPSSCQLKRCNFISYAAISLSTSDLEECSFISGAGLLTYQGGKLIKCLVLGAGVSVALLWNVNVDPNTKLDGTTFTSGGTGHGIEFGSSTPSEISLTDVMFIDYGADETTDAAIYNNSGKHLTINILGVGSTPTVRNGAGATTDVITLQKSYSFTVKNEAGAEVTGYEWRLYKNPTDSAYGTEIAGNENEPLGGRSYIYTYTGDTPIVLQVMHDLYTEYILKDTLKNADKTVAVILKEEVND